MRIAPSSIARLLVACALACGLLSAGIASAQVINTPPGADHYLVYQVLNPPTFTVPVAVGDQFIPFRNTVTFTLEYFMTPVNKNNEGIIDPVTHYTWWRIDPAPFGATAVITNQFGTDQGVSVYGSHYLLNPARKNQTGSIPPKNHYVVYDAFGLPPERPVALEDQFGPWQGVVDAMVFFAPPAMKIYQGLQFPIDDPVDHLAVYRLLNVVPPLTTGIPVIARDEFGDWQLVLGPQQYLCVPSFKTGVVGTKSSTWGQIKTLYR